MKLLLSIALFALLPTSSYAESWPKPQCQGEPYWLEFSTAKLCIPKQNVTHLNILHSELPSFTVTTVHGELIFQLQTAENITGGLHSKYGLDLASYFIALKNKDKPAIDYNIAYQVHELTSPNDIGIFNTEDWLAVSLINNTRSFDELFIFNKSSQHILHIGGQFDSFEAKTLLAQFRLP
ncbi:hypothetical protein WLQ65_12550 [Pseudoalteromonas piscicida]|uniref:hypothetical protein n=1 Tax=Pseudoalteromonas piscicida TaxID=43662 RepID=UPI001CB820D8|nr:hypothetical protein [Pseudoalteromonas piscicida]